MQRAGWMWIFEKMNMAKYATRGLKEDINKFVETQTNIPFTMKNIYKMLEIVVGTAGQRMDKAIVEVFDKVTSHHADNRMGLEGWKTNSHYLLTRRFIMPGFSEWGSAYELTDDMIKALCYISGSDFDDQLGLEEFIRYPYLLKKEGKYVRGEYGIIKEYHLDRITAHKERIFGSEIEHNEFIYGKWLNWGFFKVRKYKKGTVHFEFANTKLWERFNSRVARIKGYPLMEKREATAYQDRQNGRKPMAKKVHKVLVTIPV